MEKLLTAFGIACIGAGLYMWDWHFGGGLVVTTAGFYCFTSDWEFDLKVTKDKKEDV